MKGRFLVEGLWQGRVVHREAHLIHGRKKFRTWLLRTPSIKFSDGTRLDLCVRDLRHREHVVEIKGYTSLIADCFRANVYSVEELRKTNAPQT